MRNETREVLKALKSQIPNVITTIRIIAIPFVALFIWRHDLLTALVVYIAAMLTDIVDGYIARKYNLSSPLGAVLDAIADKLMAITVLLFFTFIAVLPWFVIVIIFAKELLMVLGGYKLYNTKNIVAVSNRFGKISAFILNVSIGTVFLHQYIYPADIIFVAVGLLLSVANFFQYLKKYLDLKNSNKHNSIITK